MFSILFLTHENLPTFKRCFESGISLFMDERVKEILILDNGSKNKEFLSFLKMIEKNFSKVNIIYSGENLGVASGRKKLYEMASEKFICSLDSDVVFENCSLFLSVVENILENGEISLIGGGGGDHKNFPSVFLEDVLNKHSDPDPLKITLVDDVAGWCHCFKKSLLEKVFIDEDFSPFWGEDTDFSLQVKKLGKKSAIFGKGIINHKWSSCSNQEKIKTLKLQWEKLVLKWNDYSGFKFDQEWYKEIYHTETPYQDFFSKGISHGRFFSREIVEILYGKEYLEKPIEDLEEIDTIGKLCYKWIKIVSSSIDFEKKKIFVVRSPEYLEKIGEDENVIVICDKFIKRKGKTMVVRCNFETDCDMMIFMAVIFHIENYSFDSLEAVGFNFDDFNLNKNRSLIGSLIDIEREPPETTNVFTGIELKKILNTEIFKNIFHASLKIPFIYENKISPEYSPRHILSELFFRVKDLMVKDKPSVITFLVTDENFDLEFIEKEKFNTEVVVVNTKEYGLKKIIGGEDYTMDLTDFSLTSFFKKIGEYYEIYDFEKFVYIDLRKFTIESGLDEFYERLNYKNMMMVEGDESFFGFDMERFCLIENIADTIIEHKSRIKNMNEDQTFLINLLKKISFSSIWKKRPGPVEYFYREEDLIGHKKDFPLIYL